MMAASDCIKYIEYFNSNHYLDFSATDLKICFLPNISKLEPERTEAAVLRCSSILVFFKNLQNPQENTYAGITFE